MQMLRRFTELCRFNTQPPEGGWENRKVQKRAILMVSTHSRLKAAGFLH